MKLRDFLINAPYEDSKMATLKAEFLMETHADNTVLAQFWYTSSDDKSLDFIRYVSDYLEPIIRHVNFEPRFVTWACQQCIPVFKQRNCVSDGKYCSMQHDLWSNISGREIIMEDLRQYCLYEIPHIIEKD